MAYMNQEKKKELAPQIKAVLKKYKVKGSIAIQHHSKLIVNIKSGNIKFPLNGRGYGEVNHVGKLPENCTEAEKFLYELWAAMNGEGSKFSNFDNSDPMTDYFHVGWYCQIKIGDWGKEYQLTA